MRILSHFLLAAAALSLGIAGPAMGKSVSGTVHCDVNNNEILDDSDEPLASVEVVAEADSGGVFSDLTTVDGFYLMRSIDGPVGYTASLTPETLPVDSVVVGGNAKRFEITVEDPFVEDVNFLVQAPSCSDAVCGDGYLDEGETCDDGNNEDGDGCSATCEDEVSEGCTPGYWRQRHHFDSYPAPLTPDTLFSDVFEDAFPDRTLREVTRLKRGGLNALGRHTAAALLNAASADVDYGLSQEEVIESFNAVYDGSDDAIESLKDDFESLNEMGCPLN
jgi:cysteine-rich repeat protein